MTLEQSLGDITFTRTMVDAFRHATKDNNKVHNIFALGTQAAFALRRKFEQQLGAQLQERACVSQTHQFGQGIVVDATVQCTYAPTANPSTFEVKMYLPGIEVPVVKGELVYGTLMPAVAPDVKKREFLAAYHLSHHDAAQTALGIGQQGRDYLALASGLTSPAMMKDARNVIKKAQKLRQEEPVYVRQTIDFFASSASTPANIIVVTDCRLTEPRKSVYRPHATVISGNETLLRVSPFFMFAKSEEIYKTIEKARQLQQAKEQARAASETTPSVSA
jgi:hypothetical protein